MLKRNAKSTVHAALLALLMLALLMLAPGCAMLPEGPPEFQPLTLDLSADLAALAAPQDPNAPPLRPVYCVAGKGMALIDKRWMDFKQTGFELPADGHPVSVRLDARRKAAMTQMRAFYDAPGQKMVFCPLIEAPAGTVIDCASLYALEEDLGMSIKRTFDVPDVVQGGQISCGYDKENLRPL